ncbi:undecaprenyl-diphosphatase [Metabacillus sp. RGM 3146]|uniref:undecaprenyl-diphosphatase n=1 Tax=Metabacillus sp. RGM 3146 TaxID=3401092 RepID=UPI003B98E3F3
MNYELFQLINRWSDHFTLLDEAMIGLTYSVPYAALFIFIAVWFKSRSIKNKYTALYAAFSSVLGLITNAILHHVYYHPRPFIGHHVHQLIPHTADSSFVSDHSVLVFALAFTLMLRRDSFRYIVLVWAIAVGISRVYTGVHYPADVIGSAIISFGTSILVIRHGHILEPIMRVIFNMYTRLTAFFTVLVKNEK